MFENFYVGQNESKRNNNKEYKLNLLLQKYVELQKIDQLGLTVQQRNILKKSKRSKRLVTKLIRERLTKRLKPEETFEIWHSQNNLNVNLEKQMPFKDVGDIIDEQGNDASKSLETSDSEAETESHKNIESQLNKFISTFDSSDSWTKANLLIRTRGLETLPQTNSGEDCYPRGTPGFSKYHVTNLRNLLHLNMLRRNWDLAYKVFCLLVRLPHVDIRSIWSLGIEILQQQRNAQGSAQDEHLSSSSSLFKDERFFDWLSSFYIITRSTVSNSRLVAAPIWRSGSRTHAPLYVITSLWNLLIKGEVSKVSERLEELLLEPPFNTDGAFYFLLALCQLAKCFDGEDVATNIALIKKNLDKCKQYKFEYPKELIEKELKQVFNKDNYSIDLSRNEDASSDEDEEEDEVIRTSSGTGTQEIHHVSIPMDPFDEFNDFEEDIPDLLESSPTKVAVEEKGMEFDFDLD
ncbi:hypothetical protein CLIB1423_11S02806 [[Candida] railenensis]|uniref:RNA polymerase I-specific transcription initiation factor RRN11 n=1 Tax=[Candida] railenensis TaxID=45579 RepID=A0A9P0QRG9_9ASCO|nr:hypothetical protein CLIB1423_11S02806 [[Candida] railenensis]